MFLGVLELEGCDLDGGGGVGFWGAAGAGFFGGGVVLFLDVLGVLEDFCNLVELGDGLGVWEVADGDFEAGG